MPIKLPEFSTEIHLPDYVSPDDPIIFLIIYYIVEIIKFIVEITRLHFG
jgi:hypothetical protein